MPGFGQLLNGKFLKGLLFIVCEIFFNVQSHFNEIIRFSFNGDIHTSIEIADYQWLMFYPCFYFYAMWDAYKEAGGGKSPYAFFPFVFAAYFVTVGVMYSASLRLFGFLLGPVFLPMLFVLPGLMIGFVIKKILGMYQG
nr:hypothetical protein [Bacillus benzoevorans]